MLLLDTRPSTCIPDGDVRNDVVRLNPVNGLTVIHPGYVWHETHTHTQTGDRVLVAINFHIWNRNFDELPTPGVRNTDEKETFSIEESLGTSSSEGNSSSVSSTEQSILQEIRKK